MRQVNVPMTSLNGLMTQEEEGVMGKKLVIIGGGAGGASVAAEARRRDPSLSIAIFEKGNYVSASA